MREHRSTVVATLVLGLLSSIFVAPTPAKAAYPTCNNQVEEREYQDMFPNGNSATYRTALPSASGNIVCQMGLGARGFSVVALQLAMNDCFGAKLKLDGKYEQATYDVVGFFQAVNGLQVDGIYGPQTAFVMKWGFRALNDGPDVRAHDCRWHWDGTYDPN